MREIQLTQGLVAFVDDCDFERLNQVKWSAKKHRNAFYASRHLPIVGGKRPVLSMHHAIIGKPSKGLMVDHINGCGTDNRKNNLRFVTNRQNGQNNKNCKKSSQYPGVNWDKERKKWYSCIGINGKTKSLGRFTNEKEAFEAYKQAVNDLGEKMVGDAT